MTHPDRWEAGTPGKTEDDNPEFGDVIGFWPDKRQVMLKKFFSTGISAEEPLDREQEIRWREPEVDESEDVDEE